MIDVPEVAASSDDTDRLLRAEGHRQVLTEGATPELGHVVAALLVGALIYGNTPHMLVVTWASALLALIAIRMRVRRQLSRDDRPDRAYRAFQVTVGLVALCWGVGTAVVAKYLALESIALIVMVLSGLLAAATATLSASKICFRTYLAGMMIPPVIGIAAASGDREHTMAVVLIMLYAAFMVTFHQRTHNGLLERLQTIARLRRSEMAAADQRARVEALLTGAPEAVVVVDDAGIVQQVNPRFEELFGYTMSESVGRVLNDLIVPEPEHVDASELERRALRGESVTSDTTRMRKDGTLVPVHLAASRIAESSELFVIYQDATEQLAARQAILDAWSAAERANQAKSAFLANMSHELRTPLNSVIGFANVLLRHKGSNLLQPKDAMYVERIHDNGRHLLGLINSILDLSKVESGKLEVELSDVSLGTLIEDTIAQLQPQVQGRPVALVAQHPVGLASLRTDAVKLKQVIINLVANALKFTEEGSVTVRVLAEPASGRALGIEVRDTGIGIAADRLQAVFEAFQQADNTTSRRFGGTGLGLTITRALCELMGYTITLESTVGVGSTFRVLFGTKVVTSTATVAAPVPAPRSGGRRVLVIDDDADARLLLAGILEDCGCEVLQSGRGAHGIAMAREHRPDLITVDVLMPEMNGLEVINGLRNDAELKGIPVALVSVIASEQRNRAIDAVALIDKPVERSQIEALLRRHLSPDGNERLAAIIEGLPVAVG